MQHNAIFEAQTYQQWLNDHPESHQAETWRAALASLTVDQVPLPGAGEFEANPPGSNRGVQLTQATLTDALTLDWLACTVDIDHKSDLRRVLSELCERFPCELMKYGGFGYTRGLSFFETGRVYWNPDRLEMGVHVMLTSRTLTALAEFTDWNAGAVLSYFLVELGAQPTRVDVALDTTADVVSKAEQSVNAGHLTTRSRVVDVRRPKRLGKPGEVPTVVGHSVLIGSRQSETYVRLYDKALESGSTEPWYRLEFEFKGDRAGAVTELLLAGDTEAVRGVMLAHLDFKRASDTDQNTTRWQTARWWSALLATAVKHPLRLGRVVKPSIERISDWLDRQVGPSLAVWWVYCEQQGIDLSKWVMSFAPRWGPVHKAVLSTF